MAQAKGGGEVVMVRKPNIGKIILIVGICVVIGFFGVFYTFFGKMTGTVATDGTRFAREAPAYTNEGRTVTLNDGTVALIPDVDTLNFTSENTVQDLSALGNPAGNEENDLYFTVEIQLSGQQLSKSELLNPGEGLGEVDLAAIFKPFEYQAQICYNFYRHDDKGRLQYFTSYFEPVTLSVTGGTDYYDQQYAEHMQGVAQSNNSTVTTTTVDSQGNVVSDSSEHVMNIPGFDTSSTSVDAEGNTTTVDSHGNVTVTDPDGNVISQTSAEDADSGK